MEKINNTNPQAMPLWERNKNSRGHRSAVDGALQAHRQRRAERQTRTQDRLDRASGVQNPFFKRPNTEAIPSSNPIQIQSQPQATMIAAEQKMDPEVFFSPRQIDDMLNEAQLGSSSDSAQLIVNKEMLAAEEGPVDDVPKGSYVDYTV